MRKQNLRVIRLGNKIVSSEIHAHQLIDVAVAAGHNNNRHSRFLPDFPADQKTVVYRQVDIEKDQVRMKRKRLLRRVFKPLQANNFITVLFQKYFELVPYFFIIFYD